MVQRNKCQSHRNYRVLLSGFPSAANKAFFCCLEVVKQTALTWSVTNTNTNNNKNKEHYNTMELMNMFITLFKWWYQVCAPVSKVTKLRVFQMGSILSISSITMSLLINDEYRSGATALQLRAITAPAGDLSWVASTHVPWLQFHGVWCPLLASVDICTHMYIPVYRYTHTHFFKH